MRLFDKPINQMIPDFKVGMDKVRQGGANGDPGSPSHIAFAELLNGDGCEGDGTDAQVCQTPRFAPIDKDSVVFQPSPKEQSEVRGTEDPRMTYDKDAQLYYLLYSSSCKAMPPSASNLVVLFCL